jgi:hypothetical protein
MLFNNAFPLDLANKIEFDIETIWLLNMLLWNIKFCEWVCPNFTAKMHVVRSTYKVEGCPLLKI